MGNPWEGATFLFIWTGFLLLMSGGIALFFFWGVRSDQFSDQERARFLALSAEIPDPGSREKGATPEQDRGRLGR